MDSKIITVNIFFLIVISSGTIIPARLPMLMISNVFDLGQRPTYMWTCRFETDFCSFKNQYNMASFKRRFDLYSPLFGETSMVYLNISTAGMFQAARLESDYFATDSQSDACLSIRYLMYGTGPVKMYLIQQDTENRCIWVDNNESIDIYGRWREAKLTIDLRAGEPRFFIEAHIDARPPRYGIVAISRVSFTYGPCDVSDVNQCALNEDSSGYEPIPSAVK